MRGVRGRGSQRQCENNGKSTASAVDGESTEAAARVQQQQAYVAPCGCMQVDIVHCALGFQWEEGGHAIMEASSATANAVGHTALLQHNCTVAGPNVPPPSTAPDCKNRDQSQLLIHN